MKRLLVLSAVAVSALYGARDIHGAVNADNADGYFQRGVAMYLDKNYNGCIDQMLQIRNLSPEMAGSEDVHYYLAMATLYSGDDEAVDMLKAFLDRFPQTHRVQDVTAAIGDYYFTRGDYGEAIAVYTGVNAEALTADRREDVAYRLAYSYMMLGENDKALAIFEGLTSDKRYGNAARFYKAYIAYSLRDYANARFLFGEVNLDQEPGQAARYYLCQLDFLDGKYAKAYSEAVNLMKTGRLEEFKPELNRIAGESLFNLGNTAEALPYLRSYVASARSPRPSAYYILGVNDYENGNYSEAIAELQKAVGNTDVTGQSAYLYLGQSYVKTGDTNSAILAFEKASKMDFDASVSETAAYNYIAARMDGGRVPFANSVDMLEDFLRKYPRSQYADAVRESLVTGYMSSSDFDSALRILNSAPNPTPRMLQAKQGVLLMLGSRDYQSGDVRQALRYFLDGASISQGSDNVAAQCRLWAANCYYDLDQYDKAADNFLAYLSSADTDDTNRLSAYYNLGYTRLRQQRFTDGYKDFIRVAENPAADAQTRADAYNRAADCLYCQHEFDRAATYYNKAYQTFPQAGDYALFQQAQMSGYRRDYRKRIELLDQMLQRFPTSPLAPEAQMARAESYSVLDNTPKAIEIYELVMKAYPATEQARQSSLKLAMNRLNIGDRQGAVDGYKYVAKTYPTSDEARVALDDLKNIYASDGRLPDYVAFVNSLPNAPKVEISELDETAFAAAEERYQASQNTDRLIDYLKQFPDGANVPAALLLMAQDADERGDYSQAESYALRIVKDYPDSRQAELAYYIKASNEAGQGKGEMALESFRQLEKRASSADMLALARMGVLTTAIDLGHYNDALDASALMLASSTSNADLDQVRFYRAFALDRTGKNEDAWQIWQQLAANPSTLIGSKSAVYMIESLIEKGELGRAEKMANEFIDAGSPHNYWYARGFIAYSDVLRASGKKFEADEYLKALRSNYPGSDADIFEMIESRLSE